MTVQSYSQSYMEQKVICLQPGCSEVQSFLAQWRSLSVFLNADGQLGQKEQKLLMKCLLPQIKMTGLLFHLWY